MTTNQRTTSTPVDPLFLERWSPRAFDGSKLDTADLFTMFDAARWAPSSFNGQPWRFIYAHRDSAAWPRFLSLLMPFNAMWAQRASVLVFVVSDTLIQLPRADSLSVSHSHSFDAGAAWVLLALQATRLGYHAHGMTGVEFERARTELSVPDRFRIEAAVAIGRIGDKSTLPPEFQAREAPNGRKELKDLVMEGSFLATAE
jgi:nitroreductase